MTLYAGLKKLRNYAKKILNLKMKALYNKNFAKINLILIKMSKIVYLLVLRIQNNFKILLNNKVQGIKKVKILISFSNLKKKISIQLIVAKSLLIY